VVRPSHAKGLLDGYKSIFKYIGHLSGDMFIGGRQGAVIASGRKVGARLRPARKVTYIHPNEFWLFLKIFAHHCRSDLPMWGIWDLCSSIH
jgi:hypothetical protein